MEHTENVENIRNAYIILVGKPDEEIKIARHAFDRRIILNWILKQKDAKILTGFNCLGIGTCSSECGNEISGLTKRNKFSTI
jgi:hypothetical protein